MSRSYTRRLSSIYPKKSVAETLVEEAHLQTVHGGVTLRELVKRIIKRCYGCKRFNISHHPKPSQGLIPTNRTKQGLPF